MYRSKSTITKFEKFRVEIDFFTSPHNSPIAANKVRGMGRVSAKIV